MNGKPILIQLALVGVLAVQAAHAQSAAPAIAQQVDPTAPVMVPAAPASAANRSRRGAGTAIVTPGPARIRPRPLSTALIVLTTERTEEQLTALTEDLNIMCRILDRTLNPDEPTSGDIFRNVLLGHSTDQWIGRLFAEHASWTECLYVEGYGPLFLINVDFPLLPPPAQQRRAEADPNAPRDPLWAQVSRELRSGPGDDAPLSTETAPVYSAEKVLAFKTALTRALKHAVNIRGLAEDGNVTIMVRSRYRQRQDMLSLFASESNAGPDRVILPLLGDVAQVAGPSSRLVIRAAAADIRAFASGDLSFADFEKRLETTQY